MIASLGNWASDEQAVTWVGTSSLRADKALVESVSPSEAEGAPAGAPSAPASGASPQRSGYRDRKLPGIGTGGA